MACGINYLGFPLRLDIHTPDLTEEEASRIIRSLGKRCKSVLITYLNKAREITEFSEYLGTNYVQLHGPVEPEELVKIKKAKKIFIIKSLIIGSVNEKCLVENMRFEPYVDAFITDTFDPNTGASGATGLTHDWNVSKRIVEISSCPVILAGGINHTNVREAIRLVKPAGVDSHTGVEDLHGNKDPILVKKFMEETTKTFDELLNRNPEL